MNDLIKKINNWVKTNEYKDSVLKEQEELKKLEEFNNIFNENKISNMSIDEYVIGKGEKTFCYYVEQKLKFFGNISGRTNAYQKFVIYWDDLKNKYVFGGKNHKNRKGFGSNINEIFTNIKEQLLEIIKFSKENDYKSISLSPFNKQFKNKLAFLYNHKNQLPIYSEDHLDKILKLLEINFDSLDTVESKRKALWDFYTKNSINKILSSNMFIAFIYSNSGFLNKLKNNIKLIDFNVDVLEESNNKKIQKKIILLDIETEKKKKEIGQKGEKIVLDYLEKNKKILNIKNIYNWCFGINQDDSKGYDFSYTTNDDKEFFVEVKTTIKTLKDNIVFEMSKKEFSVMNENRNKYFIYFISDVNNEKSITIKRISSIEIGNGIPSNYTFNLKKINNKNT